MIVVDRRYSIIKQINKGGIGRIFLAYDNRLKNYVVLKCVDGTDQDIEEVRAEAKILTKLHHEHLPQVIDFVKGPGGIYTIMEYIRGHSFKEYLDKGTRFSEEDIIRWSIEICKTLEYLHKQNPPIIHSDLKPGNIMLMKDGNIFVIDFNISSTITNDSSAQVIGATMGYAPPEQIMACRYNDPNYRIDARADIYSFGATIYHLLTGRKIQLNREGYAVHINQLNPEVNEILANIIMKCLEPRPENRYQNVIELLHDLNNIYVDDSRYKKLIRRQNITYIMTVIGFFVFLMTAIAGWYRYGVEQRDLYQNMVKKIENSTSYAEMEAAFDDAVQKNSRQLDAYYYKAKWLYEHGTSAEDYYDECITFIQNETIYSKRSGSDVNYGKVYYILGKAYLDTGIYSEAKEAFDNAIEKDPDTADYYVGLAEAELNQGNIEEATDALTLAQENGLSNNEAEVISEEIENASITYY